MYLHIILQPIRYSGPVMAAETLGNRGAQNKQFTPVRPVYHQAEANVLMWAFSIDRNDGALLT